MWDKWWFTLILAIAFFLVGLMQAVAPFHSPGPHDWLAVIAGTVWGVTSGLYLSRAIDEKRRG